MMKKTNRTVRSFAYTIRFIDYVIMLNVSSFIVNSEQPDFAAAFKIPRPSRLWTERVRDILSEIKRNNITVIIYKQ